MHELYGVGRCTIYEVKNFDDNLKTLNAAQREAVQTLEGPVLVVAGPGTGKTQLLSMRAANIVRATDAAPQNILCLTFTDSAAAAMRERLVSLMGVEGNKVAVHTFHGFGTEVINQNPEFFYNGAQFSPADDMASYEILLNIFKALPHNNPLAKTMNGEFAALHDAAVAISHLKRAGLLPKELLKVLDHNQTFYEFAEPLLAPVFATRLSKKSFDELAGILDKLNTFKPAPIEFAFVKPVADVCLHELTLALSEATAQGKTTPLTSWRNAWLEKNNLGDFVFKDRLRATKLRALAHVYEKYREDLAAAELFDFDDMVSLVAHTLEQKPELRFNLQEQFLYIMVDEFQDTNGAQLRLLSALAENPVNEDRPNILAVGDDDQAIYAFQGAELNNVVDFTLRYRDVKVITLTENYRSTEAVLNEARQIITKAETRLETTLQNISKLLTPNNKGQSKVELNQFLDPESEYQWVAKAINVQIKAGEKPEEIAVIARNHKQLLALLPHLHAAGIATNYERRNNVLENPHLCELITLAEVVVYIGDGRFDLADGLLPELLSYSFWQIKTSDIWQLSLRAYKERRMWLELMLESPSEKLRAIGEFLVVGSQRALHEPLERMLDVLIGAHEQQAPDNDMVEPFQNGGNGPTEEFVSPYRAYYFNDTRLKTQPEEYLSLLSGIKAIGRQVESRAGSVMLLGDFVELINLHQSTDTPIVDNSRYNAATSSVAVMTAHKAKGLEFGSVYILGCQDEIWGRRVRHRSSSLGFPQNLPIEPAGATYDDALRLFFVAVTRAKQNVFLTCHKTNGDGKPVALAEFLLDSELKVIDHPQAAKPDTEGLSPGWESRHLSLPKVRQSDLLQPTLELYKLSATHINNFIDITRGGPQAFLLQNLLRFPQAMTPHQAYGYAVHAVLQRAHTHLTATGERRPIEDILHDYELHLQQSHLSESEMLYWLQKGSDVLGAYLNARYSSFSPQQIPERNFYGQDVVVADVRLTGALDLMQVNKVAKTVTVTDYKTGKSVGSWRASDEFVKIKLHKYRQQLMLYKLLIEHSRDYSGYTVEKGVLEFVEPDPDGNFNSLELIFDAEELTTFKKLIYKIWQHIMHLDFPDTSHYPANYKGILQFEKDLLGD